MTETQLIERVQEIRRSNSPSISEAVKLIKELTGWTLKESKEFVDKHW